MQRGASIVRSRRWLAAVVGALLIFAFAGPASATVLTTCNASDLTAAVAAFNAGTSDQTITLKAGCVYPLSSQLTVSNATKKLTILGKKGSTISGQNLTRVFQVDSGAQLTLSNITVANGSTLPSGGGGAGILNAGTVNLIKSTLTANSSDDAAVGGGIANTGTLTILNSTLSSNTANDEGGGGIANLGGTVTITKSTLSDNLGTNGIGGGGVYSTGGSVTVTRSAFLRNHADNGAGGGGIYMAGGTLQVWSSAFTDNTVTNSSHGGAIADDNATVTVSNSIFTGNNADNSGGGGGIDGFHANPSLTVDATTFIGNFADDSGGGGGIAWYTPGTLVVTNSTFIGNSADDSGGGGALINGSGTATVTNSTFASNHATIVGSCNTCAGGGAIANIQTGATLTVIDTTLWDNVAAGSASGGGIWNGSGASTTLKQTIVANSPSGGDCAGAGAPPVTDGGYNLDDDGSCGFTTANHSFSNTPSGLDPAGLEANGGPTQTIELEPGSVAIDVVPVASLTVSKDQRGFSRPDKHETVGDIGAFEFQDK